MVDLTRPSELLATVEAIYAAGLDPSRWRDALASATRLIGGVGTTLEVIDRTSLAHRQFLSFGIAPAGEIAYLSNYASLNPRFPAALKQQPGEMSFDYLFTNERGIDRSPFYCEFLGPQDLRYTIGGILDTPAPDFGVIAVQRSPRQEHAGAAEVALMERIVPHAGKALALAARLRGADLARGALEAVLDRLADGIVLLDRDGKVVLANEWAGVVARRGDGIAIERCRLSFAVARARHDFAVAFRQVLRLNAGIWDACSGVDFTVPRRDGGPAYLLLMRPIAAGTHAAADRRGAVAILAIVDPRSGAVGSSQAMRIVLGLTQAEATLAAALLAGTSPIEYARDGGLSINTVYSHLHRIKAKAGCTRMAALIRRLNECVETTQARPGSKG